MKKLSLLVLLGAGKHIIGGRRKVDNEKKWWGRAKKKDKKDR